MKVDYVNAPGSNYESGVHEPLFPEVAISERCDNALGYWILREEGVAVAQGLATEARVVYSMFRIGVTALLLYVLQQVYVAIPVGGLIDFLKSYDVWRMSFDEPGNLLEVFSDAVRAVKALIEG